MSKKATQKKKHKIVIVKFKHKQLILLVPFSALNISCCKYSKS